MKQASASIARLEALNPQIWAYFASLKFGGNQVAQEGGSEGGREGGREGERENRTS